MVRPKPRPEDIVQYLLCVAQLLELENALAEVLTNVRRNRMLANSEACGSAAVFSRPFSVRESLEGC